MGDNDDDDDDVISVGVGSEIFSGGFTVSLLLLLFFIFVALRPLSSGGVSLRCVISDDNDVLAR